MQFNIDVLTVSAPQTIPTKNGKSYQMIEVAYKRDGKVEGKKLMSFSNPAVFKAVQELAQGDTATVTAEKGEPNAQGQSFWNWVAISSGDSSGEAGAAQPVSASKVSGTGTTGKPVSNYETREEREIKQRYIVRQSSLTNAINLLSHGKAVASVTQVIDTAKQFEAFVFGEHEETLADSLHEVYEDDVPL